MTRDSMFESSARPTDKRDQGYPIFYPGLSPGASTALPSSHSFRFFSSPVVSLVKPVFSFSVGFIASSIGLSVVRLTVARIMALLGSLAGGGGMEKSCDPV